MANDADTYLAHSLDGVLVHQRTDGFVNATELCKAAGKRWNDYAALPSTKEFLDALARQLPDQVVIGFVQSKAGRPDLGGGTWVHPRLAVNLATWLNPRFAVLVAGWVEELLKTGHVNLNEPAVMVPVAQVEVIVRKLLAERHPTNRGPNWTIQQRLIELRWFTATKRQRSQIRHIAGSMIRTVLGQEIEQLNGTNVYSRDQVQLLDKAIEVVRFQAERQDDERGHGLFAGVRS